MQMSIFDFTREEIKIDKPIRLIELFSGYGSQAMALERLGVPFEKYKVIEYDEYAINSYNACHGTNFPAIDIKDIHGKDLEIVDTDKYAYILFYSFPCTDISIAGGMAGFERDSGTSSSLLWEVERILKELDEKPMCLFMENVPAIHSPENRPHFQVWLNFLESLGYSNYIQDLNASDYGVAQSRDRTFVVSLQGEKNYHFPVPMPLRYCVEDYFQELTDEEALKYIVKTEKAKNLLVDLDEKGTLK